MIGFAADSNGRDVRDQNKVEYGLLDYFTTLDTVIQDILLCNCMWFSGASR